MIRIGSHRHELNLLLRSSIPFPEDSYKVHVFLFPCRFSHSDLNAVIEEVVFVLELDSSHGLGRLESHSRQHRVSAFIRGKRSNQLVKVRRK